MQTNQHALGGFRVTRGCPDITPFGLAVRGFFGEMNPLITIGFTTILAKDIVTVTMCEHDSRFVVAVRYIVPVLEEAECALTTWDTAEDAAEEHARINKHWEAVKDTRPGTLPVRGGAS